MTTHSGHRLKYGRMHGSDKAGTLHVPMLEYCDCRCEMCGHRERCIKTSATGGKYLCSACRYLIVDADVSDPLSTRAKRAGAEPQFSRWKRRSKKV